MTRIQGILTKFRLQSECMSDSQILQKNIPIYLHLVLLLFIKY